MVRPGYYYYTNLRARRIFWVCAGILALIGIARNLGSFFTVLKLPFLFFIADLRFRFIVFAAVIVLIFYFRSVKRTFSEFVKDWFNQFSETDFHGKRNWKPYTNSYDYILALEAFRIVNGYKPGWLYYRCLDENLINEYEELQRLGRIERRFTSSRSNSERDTDRDDDNRKRRRAESDPYEVLGVPPGAPPDQVKRAYHELIKLYHPDRVHGLGPELQELAKAKTIAINAAYEKLSQSGSKKA